MHTWGGCGRCRIPHSRRAYWLAKLQRNRARDLRTTRALRRQGWNVLILWECQLRDRARLTARIRRFLNRPSPG